MDDSLSFLPTLPPTNRQGAFRIKKLTSKSTFQHSGHYYPSSMTTSLSQSRYHEPNDEDDDRASIKRLLDQSREETWTDKLDKPTVGQEAIKRYHKHLKILDRVQEENHFKSLPDSLYTVMHRTASEQTLLPCKIGLIKFAEPRDMIKINSMKYGDKYIMMLQEGIKKQNQVEVFELSDCRITSKVSGTLMQSMSKSAKEVNLGKNRIGQIGVTNISNSLVSKDCRIECLDLEDNQLGNKLVIELCGSIKQNKTLTKLNLSKNYITSTACSALSVMLLDNTNIKELYLYWNQIKGEGGNLIFQALLTNSELKVLDMAYNSLGIQTPCATSLAELLKANVELRHVDFSFNYFNFRDTTTISEGLNSNRSIYGFHFTGNKGYVDNKGFLIPIESAEEDEAQHQISQRIRSCRYINQQRIRQFRDVVLKDCCWICEGWSQNQISWKSDDVNVDPTFIHLSYQDFSGLYFGKPDPEQKGRLSLPRMLPPGTTKYFFTVGEQQLLAADQPQTGHPITIYNVKVAGQEQTVTLQAFNEISVEINKQVIDQYYESTVITLPRTRDPVYIPPKLKKRKVIWTFPISLFKPWVQNEEELVAQCFEIDWNGSRIPKIIKNEQDHDNTKKFMKALYPHFKDTYRHYSSFNPVGEVWAIQSSVFLSILQAVKLVPTSELKEGLTPMVRQSIVMPRGSSWAGLEDLQGKDDEPETAKLRFLKAIIKPQDLDLKFIGTLSGTEKGNPRKPDRGMIRFQFLEVWVRIAEQKYMQNQVTTTILDSMRYLWEDNLKQEFMQYSAQPWRNDRYWNEHCDYCYKFYRPLVDHIYLINAKKKVKPGQKPFMSLQELIDLCMQAGLTQYDHFASQVPFLAFNKAMMTKVDELTQDRIFQMSFVEFLEAFARIAEEASIPPIVGAFPEGTEWNLPKLMKMPLHYKIESLLLRCLETVAEPSFRANYRRPDKSFFTPVPDSDDE